MTNFNLFMLIKDSNCVPFWNYICEELSKQIFEFVNFIRNERNSEDGILKDYKKQASTFIFNSGIFSLILFKLGE